MQKINNTKKATGAGKKFVSSPHSFLCPSVGGKGSGGQNDFFISPPFFFPYDFLPCAVSLTAYVRWVLNMASDFFFFQLLSTRVFAFWQLAARQPHWTLIQLELNWTFPGWIEFFLNELNFFHPWRIAKESKQTTKKPIRKEKVTNKKERKKRVFYEYLKQKGKK